MPNTYIFEVIIMNYAVKWVIRQNWSCLNTYPDKKEVSNAAKFYASQHF